MTQKQIVINQLREEGSISRNWTIRNYIYRLAAIIKVLSKEGWEFSAHEEKGDYVYYLKFDPENDLISEMDKETQSCMKPQESQNLESSIVVMDRLDWDTMKYRLELQRQNDFRNKLK